MKPAILGAIVFAIYLHVSGEQLQIETEAEQENAERITRMCAELGKQWATDDTGKPVCIDGAIAFAHPLKGQQ